MHECKLNGNGSQSIARKVHYQWQNMSKNRQKRDFKLKLTTTIADNHFENEHDPKGSTKYSTRLLPNIHEELCCIKCIDKSKWEQKRNRFLKKITTLIMEAGMFLFLKCIQLITLNCHFGANMLKSPNASWNNKKEWYLMKIQTESIQHLWKSILNLIIKKCRISSWFNIMLYKFQGHAILTTTIV